MRLQPALPWCVVAVFIFNPPSADAQSQAPAFQGAWRIVRTSLTTGDEPRYVDYDQPSLVLFADRYYSLMYVEGNRARALFSNPGRPTDAEKIAAYDTFVGHSGSYTVVDSIIRHADRRLQVADHDGHGTAGDVCAVRFRARRRHAPAHAPVATWGLHDAVDTGKVRFWLSDARR